MHATMFEAKTRRSELVEQAQNPFDRMIAAQAFTEDIPVVSAEKVLEQFGVRRLW